MCGSEILYIITHVLVIYLVISIVNDKFLRVNFLCSFSIFSHLLIFSTELVMKQGIRLAILSTYIYAWARKNYIEKYMLSVSRTCYSML